MRASTKRTFSSLAVPNYRRFFTIADLVGVRVEDPLVFEATHGYILRLVSKSPAAGLRVDHIDGLRDPLAYLNRLQERLASDDSHKASPPYVLVEKILARHESLPEDWPVSGTTGYDYLNEANGIFVEPQCARRMEEIFSAFTGRQQNFADVVYEKKKLVMNTLLGVEMRTLGRQLAELAAQAVRSWYIAVFQLPVLAPLTWRLFLARAWPTVLRHLEGVTPRDGHPAPTLASDAVSGIGLYRANFFSERSHSPLPRTSQVPVLLITVTGDRYVSPALAGADLDRWVPDLTRRTLRGKHWSVLEKKEVADLIREFTWPRGA